MDWKDWFRGMQLLFKVMKGAPGAPGRGVHLVEKGYSGMPEEGEKMKKDKHE